MIVMASAPEHADKLLALGERLPRERLHVFVFKWLDRCVRVHVPTALDRLQHPNAASALRALPELRDRAGCLEARSVLMNATRDLGGDGSEMDALAGIFCLAATLDHDLPADGPRLKDAIVGIVTSARCMGAWNEERDELADVTAFLT